MSTNKTSWVWTHFSKKDKQTVQCKICSKELKQPDRGTSSMISHLSSQHNLKNPAVPEVERAEQTSERDLQSTSCLDASQPKRSRTSDTPSIVKYMKKQTLSEILAKCAAKDGFSVKGISESGISHWTSKLVGIQFFL